MKAISWHDLVAEPLLKIEFLIHPYVPRGGTILLYGKTSIGKSPLTWEMARCVGSGDLFFGNATVPGRVLYIELDTPRQLVQPRLEAIVPAPNVWWTFLPSCHIVTDLRIQQTLRELQEQVKPDFTIINTLRQVHQGDEKDAALPDRIYKTFHAIFPQSANLFVHHDKKTPSQSDFAGEPDEAFSGHQAWYNNVQTGLHLIRAGSTVPGLLRLVHSKSQVSAKSVPLSLQLDPDGSHLIHYEADRATAVLKAYYALPEGMGKTDGVRIIAKQLKISERTVWTYLARIELTEDH